MSKKVDWSHVKWVPVETYYEHKMVHYSIVAQRIGKSEESLFAPPTVIRELDPKDLIPAQRDVSVEVVKAPKNTEPVIVVYLKGKYYVKDGHHRIAWALFHGKRKVRCRVLNT